jgi:hypothetical protein
MMLTILGSIAAFEREIMIGRQTVGIAKKEALRRHGQRRIKSLHSTVLAKLGKRLPRKWGSASKCLSHLAEKIPRKRQLHRQSLVD